MKLVGKTATYMVLLVVIALNVKSQTSPTPDGDVRLQSPSTPVTCETMLEYIDSALANATKRSSNVIIIVKSTKGGTSSLNNARSRGLVRYLEHRGFKDFQVSVDLISNVSDRVDLFVRGQLLYSLPIRRKDTLDFTPCVVGDL